MSELKRVKTIVVTGASGFIGGYIVSALLDKGYRVRALYRRETLPPPLVHAKERGAELFRFDLSKAKAPENKPVFEDILTGADVVIHAAALTNDWGKEELFYAMNVAPVKALLDFSTKAGVSQFIHISSIAVHGFGGHVDTPEDGPYYPPINPYQRSKKQAEAAALAADSPSLSVTVMRPGNVYGPGDTTTFFPIFEAMKKNRWIYVGKGESLTCPVYVGDVSDAVCSCIGNPKAKGEVFNITGGEKTTWKELLTHAASLLGIAPPKKHVPVWLARAAAAVLEGLFRLFRARKGPIVTFYRVEQVANNYHFSIQKAASLLAYSPKTSWPKGMALTVKDFISRDAAP